MKDIKIITLNVENDLRSVSAQRIESILLQRKKIINKTNPVELALDPNMTVDGDVVRISLSGQILEIGADGINLVEVNDAGRKVKLDVMDNYELVKQVESLMVRAVLSIK